MTTPLEAVANHESLFANALDLLVDGIALLGRDGRIVYVNEALRTLAAREVRYFLPPDPTHRYGIFPKGKLVAQTEDVLVDSPRLHLHHRQEPGTVHPEIYRQVMATLYRPSRDFSVVLRISALTLLSDVALNMPAYVECRIGWDARCLAVTVSRSEWLRSR